MIRKLILTYEFGGWVTGIFNDCTTASWRIDDFHVNAPTSTVVTHDYWEIEEFALSLEYTECDKKNLMLGVCLILLFKYYRSINQNQLMKWVNC